MGFLTPWYLLGLVTLGLPVWFHLLKKHRSEPVSFSSLMFFERRTQSSILHRRLQHLLLFALRAALVAALVLAFAAPYLPGIAGTAGDRRMAVLAIDRSFSMRQGDRLAEAKRKAVGVLAGLPSGSPAQVLEFAGQARLAGEPSSDKAALRAAIETVSPSDSRSSYADLVRALRSVAQSSRLPLDIHLFSDMQKTSLPAGFGDLQLPGDSRLSVHSVAAERLPNWTVESVTAPDRIFDPKRARVQATVAGFGTGAAERQVSLVVNGKVLDTKSVAVPAGGRAIVEFSLLDAPFGMSRCEVRVDAADSFPADNRFLFAVERADPRRVLFLHEPRDTRSAVYFRAALEASAEAAFALDAVPVPQSGGAVPSKYSFVVLSNVASIPANFESELRSFVRGGGALLIALGPSSAVRGKVPVLDLGLAESRYSSRSGERFQTAEWLDSGHPSVRRANRWDGVRFYQVLRIDAGDGRVVARTSDRTPLLIEKTLGAGRVLVFASTFDNISNDFPLHASFVPFVEQTSYYLAGLEERRGGFTVDAYLPLGASRGSRAAVEVIGPDGNRMLELSESSSVRDVPLAREGFYEIRHSSGRPALVAANADRLESDFEMIPAETLELWRSTGQGAAVQGGKDETGAKPRHLWWYAMLVVFALALAESLVAGRYLGPVGETA